MNNQDIHFKKQNYIHAYDGIRTTAMLGVLGFHLFPSIFPSGYFGVVTFFVMAGFLSMRNIVHIDKNGYYVRPVGTIAQKIVKLYPELLLMLTSVFLVFFLNFSEYLPGMKANTTGAILGTSNIAMMSSGESYFDAVASINPFTHLWALSIELQFYVLISLVAPFYRAKRKPAWILGLIVATVASAVLLFLSQDITHAYYGTETRMFSFTAGALLALLLQKRDGAVESNTETKTQEERADRSLLLTLLGYGVFCLSFVIFFFPTMGETHWLLLYTLLALCSLALSSDRTTPLMGTSVFRYFASRSYSIYLWHFPIMKILERALRFSGIGTAAFIVLELAIVFLVSEISYRIFRGIAKHNGNLRVASVGMTAVAAVALLLLPFQPHGEGLARYESLQLLKAQLNGEVALTTNNSSAESNHGKPQGGDHPSTSGVNAGTNEDTSGEAGEGSEGNKVHTDTALADVQDLMNAEEYMEEWNLRSGNQSVEPEEPLFYDEELAKRFDGFAKEFGIENFTFQDYVRIRDLKICIIGDSIAYMARPRLEEIFPNVELSAEKSRSIYVALSVLETMELRNDLDILILALGTNGFSPPEEFDKIAAAVPGKPIVITSIVLPWPVTEKERNDVIYKYAKDHDNIFLMDWFKHGKNRPDLFFEDAIHPHDDGLQVYSYLLAEAVHRAIKAKTK